MIYVVVWLDPESCRSQGLSINPQLSRRLLVVVNSACHIERLSAMTALNDKALPALAQFLAPGVTQSDPDSLSVSVPRRPERPIPRTMTVGRMFGRESGRPKFLAADRSCHLQPLPCWPSAHDDKKNDCSNEDNDSVWTIVRPMVQAEECSYLADESSYKCNVGGGREQLGSRVVTLSPGQLLRGSPSGSQHRLEGTSLHD